jgi:hypothetical protein
MDVTINDLTLDSGTEHDISGHWRCLSQRAGRLDERFSNPQDESLQMTPEQMAGRPVIPRSLKRGGADDPSNMQWQTIEEAKAKERGE